VFDIGVCNFWRFLKLICSILALSETDDVIILLISHLLEKKSDFCFTSKTSIFKKEQVKTT
jgi:hypothetical protein